MPLPVAGVFVHYEADTLGLANGASVTSWPDQSGNGNTLAQTGGISLPTYETPSLNGMGGVKFDATHQRIADTSLSGSPTAARTIFAVMKNPADSGAVRHITLTTNLLIAKWSTANRWIFGNSSAGGQFIEFTEAGVENATGQWTYVHQQTGAEVRWNQTQKVTGNIGAPAADTTIVLGASDANTSMTLYEWAVYNGVLSVGDIDLVEDYLFDKWFVAASFTGTGASTLDGVTSAGSGTYTPEAITGTGASTLAGVTSAGSGTYAPQGITGTGASTLQGVTSEGVGVNIIPITGTGASTLAGVTSAGVGFFGDMFLPALTCETLTLGAACEISILPVACAILSLGVECEQ